MAKYLVSKIRRHQLNPNDERAVEIALYLEMMGRMFYQMRVQHFQMSQVELASCSGLKQPVISRIESGAIDFRVSSLLALSRVFYISPQNFFPTYSAISI